MAESAETQLSELLELNNKILKEKDYDVVLSQILSYAQSTSQSDGVFIYILNDDNFFNLEVTRINSLNINKVGSDNISLYATIYLPELKNKPIKSMAESCAYNKEILNSANVFSSTDYDNKLFKRFETEKNVLNTRIIERFPVAMLLSVSAATATFPSAALQTGKFIQCHESENNRVSILVRKNI